MEMMPFFRNIRLCGSVILQICLSVIGLCSCRDSDEGDLIIGGEQVTYFLSELICEIDAKGGRAVVEINPWFKSCRIAQLAYATMHDLPGYEYAAEDYVHNGLFIYFPKLPFDYSKDDIMNMDWLRAYYPQYYWPVKDAGVELLDNPVDFDYQWIHVFTTQESVTIDAEPNPTEEDRRIILLFTTPGIYNNVIEVRQRGE